MSWALCPVGISRHCLIDYRGGRCNQSPLSLGDLMIRILVFAALAVSLLAKPLPNARAQETHPSKSRPYERTVPELHFLHDESIAHGERLSRLIEEAVAGEHRECES